MKLFYFTFGQLYREKHYPLGGHPDGWFTIEAKDATKARKKMFNLCGAQWAMQYDKEPSKDIFPLGELKRIK